MRVVVLGGTRFVGRALLGELHHAGHGVLALHRGENEPDDLAPVRHLHADRAALRGVIHTVREFRPDAVVDVWAGTRAEARQALDVLSDVPRLVVLSSGDVYRAYDALREGGVSDPLPLDEGAPVRSRRYPYRGERADAEDYEKLDVEEEYLAVRGTVLRLPMVYGAHDPQLREDFLLRRIRAGRTRMPVGSGAFLWTRGDVHELARAVRLAVERDEAVGEIINLGETTTAPVELWVRQIMEAADVEVELVRVPNDALPDDLWITGSRSQHLLFDVSKASRLLGWTHVDASVTVRKSVLWHLDHPPERDDRSFTDDDAALEAWGG